MTQQNKTRREFLKATSAVVAGVALAGQARGGPGAADPSTPQTKPADAKGLDPSKILNYDPKMGYRRLGKTGIMISEIGLGGHGSQGLENRVKVLERAAELGMNYLDTNIVGECAEYGQALRGRRDRWHIGFASWPEKITTEYEDQLSVPGMLREIDGRLKAYQTDTLDIWRPVGATWGEGQTQIATLLMVSNKALDLVAEVFDKVHQQGKVRWLGISAHNPKVFRRVLNEISVRLKPFQEVALRQHGRRVGATSLEG